MSDDEVAAFLRADEPLAKARAQFRSWAGRIEHAGIRNGPVMQRKMEMQACLDIERTLNGYAKPPKKLDDPHYLMHYERWFIEAAAEAVYADLMSNPDIRRQIAPEAVMYKAVAIVLNESAGALDRKRRDQAVKTVYAVLTVLRKNGILRHGF